MESLQAYKTALLSLAGLLAKLLKVMAHSDPTAKGKQAELYAKYQANLRLFAHSAKERWPWQNLLEYLRSLEEELGPDLDKRKVIKNKLVKDLSLLMVEKAAMPEFEAQPVQKQPPKPKKVTRPLRKKLVKQSVTDEQKQAEAEQMAQAMLDPKQMEGANQLRHLIDVINKIGPDALENQINKHYKKN